MSSLWVLHGSEQTRYFFIGVVAFINGYVGVVGYRCWLGLPSDASALLAIGMVLVGL